MAFIDRMKGQDYIDKTRAYLDYLEEHIEYVRKAFIELSKACDGMAWVGDDCSWHTLRAEVMAHDLSKFSAAEFVQYRDTFFPATEADRVNNGFDAAWEHHKLMNHHHNETVENYNDLIHMIIDWTAMGYKFGDTAESFYDKHKYEMGLSKVYETFIRKIFHRIKIYRG